MIRRSSKLRWLAQSLNDKLGNIHRYSNATFHDGGHRQSPGDTIPWKDQQMPINRLKAWWFTPAAKGSLLVSWSITLALFTYTYQLSMDSKMNYKANNYLVRNLHQESRRADMHEERAKELYEAVVATVSKEVASSKTHKKSLQSCNDSKEELQGTVVNFSGELSRERARNDVVHQRNQALVKEMTALRAELGDVKKEKRLLEEEVLKLRKIAKKFEVA
jgi:hypothetical protein